MKKRICGLDQRWLNFYLDGEFSPAEVRAIEAHLEQCPACQQELGWLRGAEVALAMAETPAPPEDFTARLMARAAAEGALARPPEEHVRLESVRLLTRQATSGFRYAWQVVPKVSVPGSWRDRTGDVVKQGASTTGRGTWQVSRWLLGRQRRSEERSGLSPSRIVTRGATTTGRGAWRASRWLLRRQQPPKEQAEPSRGRFSPPHLGLSRRWLSRPRPVEQPSR